MDGFFYARHKTADGHVQRPAQGKDGWQVWATFAPLDQSDGVDMQVGLFRQL